tara:strand:+ start:202 stop:543 length:342 start_codon:yes stop_codon:yes gene_type:complete
MKRLVLIFSIFVIVLSKNGQAQEVSYNEKADMICFAQMSKEAVTGEKLTTEEFENVWPVCLEAAQSGAVGSQNLVGMIYLEQDRDKAIYWLTRASENGHTGAIEQLKAMGITN